MDRFSRVNRHLSGSERPLLSIRLTRNERPTAGLSAREAKSLLDIALVDPSTVGPVCPGDEGEDFANFLAEVIPAPGTPPAAVDRRYQHYELLALPTGEPWVLGRGAMGITYKARDVNLHCEGGAQGDQPPLPVGAPRARAVPA